MSMLSCPIRSWSVLGFYRDDVIDRVGRDLYDFSQLLYSWRYLSLVALFPKLYVANTGHLLKVCESGQERVHRYHDRGRTSNDEFHSKLLPLSSVLLRTGG